jgi:hypothetical protein
MLRIFKNSFDDLSLGQKSVDELYQYLWETNPDHARMSLTLGRDLPSFMHLITSPKLRAIMTTVLASDNLIMPYDWCLFRVDGPATSVSHFDWHQDYPYNVISKTAATFWIPLTNIDEDMGPVHYVPNSHRDLWPVSSKVEIKQNNPNRLPIKDLARLSTIWEKSAISTGALNRGDLVIFNSLLVHRSGINQSDKYRWIMNGRYADASDPELTARGFYTARTKYPDYFKTAHPEYAD